MDDDSNIDEIAAEIDAIVAGFSFELAGEQGSLGRDLVGIAADAIAERGAQGKGPDGQDWDENKDPYKTYKDKRYDALKPGELGGQMLSLASLKGTPEITANTITMKYGTGEKPPANSRTGVALKLSEQQATDQQKAEWFTDGGRPFYELSPDDAAKITDRAQAALDDYLDKHA